MTAALNRKPDGTIELTVTIPHDLVQKTWDGVMKAAVENAEISGFRKGKAPQKLVEEKIDKEKIREEVLKILLPQAYTQAVKTHSLRPIMNPKIHVQKLEDPSSDSKQDWQFTALTCESPVVKLSNYKDSIGKITAKGKIIVPGKDSKASEVKFEDIVKALIDHTDINIPAILTENETDRLLSQTLDEVKKLGLTLDQYLASTGRNTQTLREEYRKKAENDIKLEFALQKISDEEKIVVTEKEINEAIAQSKTEEERKNLEANRYLLANILKQQKTLDFLKNL